MGPSAEHENAQIVSKFTETWPDLCSQYRNPQHCGTSTLIPTTPCHLAPENRKVEEINYLKFLN